MFLRSLVSRSILLLFLVSPETVAAQETGAPGPRLISALEQPWLVRVFGPGPAVLQGRVEVLTDSSIVVNGREIPLRQVQRVEAWSSWRDPVWEGGALGAATGAWVIGKLVPRIGYEVSVEPRHVIVAAAIGALIGALIDDAIGKTKAEWRQIWP